MTDFSIVVTATAEGTLVDDELSTFVTMWDEMEKRRGPRWQLRGKGLFLTRSLPNERFQKLFCCHTDQG